MGDEELDLSSKDLGLKPSEQPQGIDFGDDYDRVQIVGGEIISPTAVRVQRPGETHADVRKEAEVGGYLSAMTSCLGREISGRYTLEQKQADLQGIVDSAKKAGVPREVIMEHLKKADPSIAFEETVSLAQRRNSSLQPEAAQEQSEDYSNLETVKDAERKLIENLQKNGSDKKTLSSILYDMLTRRSNWKQLMAERGGVPAVASSPEARQYRSLLVESQKAVAQLGPGFGIDADPVWYGINTRADVGRREGGNLKNYTTISVDQGAFVGNLPSLAQELRQLAIDSDDIIKIKVLGNYGSFVERNDDIVVHYKNPENTERVAEVLNQWMAQHQITEEPREMGRTKVAADPSGTSFSALVADHIADWVKSNHGKYPNEVLVDGAIKYAIELSQKPPQIVKSK